VKNLRRIVVALAVAVVLLVAVWLGIGHRTPAGQPPLGQLAATTLDQLQGEFNRDADEHVRIILLLSPT
jgi:hypothetical protein